MKVLMSEKVGLECLTDPDRHASISIEVELFKGSFFGQFFIFC